MVNLRYHIVSIVAVFLAIGIGIVMGTTVVDRVTVEALNSRLNNVERSVNEAREENRVLGERVRVGQDFALQSRDFMVAEHLSGVPVMVLAVAGVDRVALDALRDSLVQAGALSQGTARFTPRMRLDREEDRKALAALSATPETPAAGTAATNREELRLNALRGFSMPGRLAALVAGGFVDYEPGPALVGAGPDQPVVPTNLEALPLAETRFAVASGWGAEVGDDALALPLVRLLVDGGVRVVAMEPGRDGPGERGLFVGPIRADVGLGPRLSTVDNLDSPMGQAAAVLALEQLAVPRLGHFGIGPGAERLLPLPLAVPAP